VNGTSAKLYIDDILHLCFNIRKFIGVQSWNWQHLWVIEITLQGGMIRLEYNNRSLFEGILKLIDEMDLTNTYE
jgi:hypothetical protein